MTKILRIKIFCFLITIIPINKTSYAQISVYDSFDTTGLSKIWNSKRMETEAYEVQSFIVRHGIGAAKLTLNAGDIAEAGHGKDLPTERDELLEIGSLESFEGKKYEYSFSMFLPDSFPIVPVRLVIAQWKQNCPKGLPCNKYSPVLAIRYVSGKLFVTLQTTDKTRNVLWETDKEIRGGWLDFKFQIRFSRQDDGEIVVFLNSDKIVDYRGVTSYAEKPFDNNSYYFKMGLYRDRMELPMSIYIDEYRKTEIKE